MVKIRVIPTLLYKDLGLVKGIGFDSWRRIGSVVQSIKVYNLREVDELVFLDITANSEGRPPEFASVDDYADDCFMPLAVGGGIRTAEDVRKLLKVGADKVVINTEAIRNPEIIREVARRFGSQCLIVSIDARKLPSGSHEVFTHSGREATGMDPVTIARRAEEMGAGEIIVTSIERDGTMTGYDIDLIRSVSSAVSIPVIASGGGGEFQDFVDAVNLGNASAVAAAAIFHFTQVTPLEVKQYMKEAGINVRA
jgi:cyclase